MSFQAEGKVASAKLLLKRVVRLTAMPAAQHLKRRGGRPSWPGALPSFNFDKAAKTSLGVVSSHVKDALFSGREATSGRVDSAPTRRVWCTKKELRRSALSCAVFAREEVAGLISSGIGVCLAFPWMSFICRQKSREVDAVGESRWER